MYILCSIALAMAQAGGGEGQGGADGLMSTLMLIVPMILIFYFFLIRPQSKRAKEHQKFLEAIKRGDKVVTSGGIWGIESDSDEKYLQQIEKEQLENLKQHLKQFNVNVEDFYKKIVQS